MERDKLTSKATAAISGRHLPKDTANRVLSCRMAPLSAPAILPIVVCKGAADMGSHDNNITSLCCSQLTCRSGNKLTSCTPLSAPSPVNREASCQEERAPAVVLILINLDRARRSSKKVSAATQTSHVDHSLTGEALLGSTDSCALYLIWQI